MDDLLEELTALPVSVWKHQDLLEETAGCSPTYLGSGCFGSAELFRDARRSLVVKTMEFSMSKDFFLREVRALVKVRGIDGMQ